jgi:DNA-binding CsgD family transcriptional regulator
MLSSPTHLSFDIPAEADRPHIHEAIRALVEMANGIQSVVECDSESEKPSEEVLIDAEVNGARYLLVRMPKLNRDRVQLSPREYEIVRMVAKGHPNKVIADVLNISSWTVCTHLRRIFAKMGVGSRAAMVAQLIEGGTLPRGSKPNHAVRESF